MSTTDMNDVRAAGALTVNEFCRVYAVGRTLTYRLISSGAIEARKVGAKTLIPRASAERWLASLPKVGSAA
jgi:excisionase family DNA binding protein